MNVKMQNSRFLLETLPTMNGWGREIQVNLTQTSVKKLGLKEKKLRRERLGTHDPLQVHTANNKQGLWITVLGP